MERLWEGSQLPARPVPHSCTAGMTPRDRDRWRTMSSLHRNSPPSLPFRGRIFCGFFSTQESSRFAWLLPSYRWCPHIQPTLLLPNPSAAHLCFLSKPGAICAAVMFSILKAPFLFPFYRAGFSNSSGSTSNLVFYDSVKRGFFHL